MEIRKIAIGLAFALYAIIAGHSTDAVAQATRTWVSGVGDDFNPCSRTAPCKTFAGAISKTADGGAIDVLDPGGFGSVTITKGITIRSTGEGGGILATGTNGVNINAPGKVVNLVNLQIDGGTSTLPGRIGVNVISASFVSLQNCTIAGFKASGDPAIGIGVRVASSSVVGVNIVNSIIQDSLIGLDVAPLGAGQHVALLNRVQFANVPTAIRAAGSATLVVIQGSVANQPITLTGGATLRSSGDNLFAPNFIPTQTSPLK